MSAIIMPPEDLPKPRNPVMPPENPGKVLNWIMPPEDLTKPGNPVMPPEVPQGVEVSRMRFALVREKTEKAGRIMAGYTVTALSLDQNGPASHFTVAVSVTDSNGLGVQDLGESNFKVRNITNETPISVAEVRSAGGGGFYRLLLKTEPVAKAGESILALVVTGRHHESGRVPGDIGVGYAMVKVKVI